jgi:hypothetical protein
MPASTVDSVCDSSLSTFLASLTTTAHTVDPEALSSQPEPDRHFERWSVLCGSETRLPRPVWQAA